MRLVLATNNKNKVKEIKRLFELFSSKDVEINSLFDLNITVNPIEDGDTLEENALIKATAVRNFTDLPILSDDTGLFVECLNDKPGVHSARYAGNNANDKDNRELLLRNMRSCSNRNAQFITSFCFFESNNVEFFTGTCEGKIAISECGTEGFGYDSIFIPEGKDQTFAEMDKDDKNKISHRTNATKKLIDYLN